MAPITQPITFPVFNRANRQPGTYVSADAVIPEGINSLGITDILTDTDAADPANRYTTWTEVSLDGTVWELWGIRLEWQGGTYTHKHTGLDTINHLHMAWSDSALAAGARDGWRVRAVLEQPQQMRVGFNVVAYPVGFDLESP